MSNCEHNAPGAGDCGYCDRTRLASELARVTEERDRAIDQWVAVAKMYQADAEKATDAAKRLRAALVNAINVLGFHDDDTDELIDLRNGMVDMCGSTAWLDGAGGGK